jgi:hypothetical protein
LARLEIEERSLVVAEKRPRLCRDDNEKQNEKQNGQNVPGFSRTATPTLFNKTKDKRRKLAR